MGLFDRGPRKPAVSVDDDDDLDPQGMALELIDAIHDRDVAGLTGLTAEQRADQVHVRWALHTYVDEVWEDAKRRGLDPATRPEWSGWAGLRDLTMALWTEAVEAQAADEELD